ncbi:unnamed protein product [Rotaria magnacalcarata]|uniref:Uncharacterized protein n=1 Tax=Rotaria magnacalcarata TaxID=392030 RepID=A0A816SCL3_9BILA|nr:unnamed protein product [Rotaria magnacalcarata]CAF3803730.1 unnamed protein product [Rotaria magnacalcarata]
MKTRAKTAALKAALTKEVSANLKMPITNPYTSKQTENNSVVNAARVPLVNQQVKNKKPRMVQVNLDIQLGLAYDCSIKINSYTAMKYNLSYSTEKMAFVTSFTGKNIIIKRINS